MIDANDSRLTDYEREIAAMRGDARFRSDEEMLACCALGLAEECGEATGALLSGGFDEFESELGDVVWYATTGAHRLDATRNELVGFRRPIVFGDAMHNMTMLHLAAARFAGRVKKWLFHDKPLDRTACLGDLWEVTRRIEAVSSLSAAESANLAKLRKRFPSGGFTAAEANARADETPATPDGIDPAAAQAMR